MTVHVQECGIQGPVEGGIQPSTGP
jgi:hypothetical protein